MPSSNLKKVAQSEVQRLESLLEKDPNFRQWRLLKQVVAEYQTEAAPPPAKISADAPPFSITASAPAAASAVRPSVEKPPSNAQQIQNAGIAHLRKITRRAPAKELFDVVKAAGIPVHGKNQVSTVAAHMSNIKGVVDCVRGEGYGLVEWSGTAMAPTANGMEFGNAETKPH